MTLIERTEEYVRKRLLELGFREFQVNNGMEKAKKAANKADAIYFWRKDMPDIVIQVDSGRWFMQE